MIPVEVNDWIIRSLGVSPGGNKLFPAVRSAATFYNVYGFEWTLTKP